MLRKKCVHFQQVLLKKKTRGQPSFIYEEETSNEWHCLYLSKNAEYSDIESPSGLKLMIPLGCRVYAGCCELYWLQVGLLPRPLQTKSLSEL